MKKPISATIDERLVAWIDSQLQENMAYRNKSHMIEVALLILKEKTEKK